MMRGSSPSASTMRCGLARARALICSRSFMEALRPAKSGSGESITLSLAGLSVALSRAALAERSRFQYNQLLRLRANGEETDGIVRRTAKPEIGKAQRQARQRN